MARFVGKVGFIQTVEKAKGVYVEEAVERTYSGDIIRESRRLESADTLNDNPVASNNISIVADPYARDNFYAMRYVKWAGALWKVTSVEVRSPRLILYIGGIYNGQVAP